MEDTKVTEIYNILQEGYALRDRLATIETQMYKITEDLVDNDGNLENAVEYVSNARISLTEFLEKLESAEVEIEL